jgi:ABC-2 type transport system permease protein
MTGALYWHFLRLRFRERLEYRGAFLLGLVAQSLGYIADFTVFWILVHRFGALGSWNWEQIAFLYSLNLMGYAIGAAFTYSPMTELESMVQRGTFDGVLIRPLNPYASLTAQMFNVGYLGHIVLASVILGWSINQLVIDWTVGKILFLAASLVGASLIHAAILTILGAWSFLFVRSGFLFGFAGSLRTFVLYPITIYSTAVQVLLTVIFPIAFVNYYPAAVLLDQDGQTFPSWIGWLTPLVGLLAFGLGYKIWMQAINRYQGAGG